MILKLERETIKVTLKLINVGLNQALIRDVFFILDNSNYPFCGAFVVLQYSHGLSSGIGEKGTRMKGEREGNKSGGHVYKLRSHFGSPELFTAPDKTRVSLNETHLSGNVVRMFAINIGILYSQARG